MNKFLATTAAAILALCTAAPALAMLNTSMPKLSRRLVESNAILRGRMPVGAMPVDLLLRERKQAQKDTTGRSDLGRSRITTRVHTIRGSSPEARQYWKDVRPSRRSIIDQAQGAMLELPPLLVKTGGKAVPTVVSHASRRTVRDQTRVTNMVRVQAAINR